METKTLDELEVLIGKWGYDRKITINGNIMAQSIKTLEETHELLEAINKEDEPEISDAVGDIVVTLIMICRLRGITLQECLNGAYETIKDRTGTLNKVGDFIKN